MAQTRQRMKGRDGKKGRFIMLPLSVFRSEACASLTHAYFRLMLALVADYNGHNNGALALTRPQARKSGIGSNATISKGLRELERRGLIVKTDPGMLRPPKPARFALTWQVLDKTEFTDKAAATHTYKNWTDGQTNKTVSDARSVGPDGHAECAQEVIGR